jgi:hypothetical protein
MCGLVNAVNMNNIYLPDILSISVNNFTLYPNGLNFNYDFQSGINLIIGGNGMGKTTMVNLIKYSVIGHYREGFDLTRTYKGTKIEKRTSYPTNYFTKRTAESSSSTVPSVTAIFRVNNTTFEVKRSLDSIEILDCSVNGTKLVGSTLTQIAYDVLCYDQSRTHDQVLKLDLTSRIEGSLPYKYEQEISKSSNMPFDDLIFFVNKILFFGEDHKTILWNNDYADVQTELFNKYFNDRELNAQRQEANRQARYFDTQGRHRSEDIRVIRNVLEKARTNSKIKPSENINDQINNLKTTLESLDVKIESTQNSRNQFEAELQIINSKVNGLSQDASTFERSQRKIENQLIQKNWVTLNHNYDLYLKSMISNEICPMCSQDLAEEYVKLKLSHQDKCIVCDQQIAKNDDKALSNEQLESKIKLSDLYASINHLQHQSYKKEAKLTDLDREFKSLAVEKRKIVSQLRVLEYNSLDNKEAPGDVSLQAFYDEIAQLEVLKDEFLEKSRAQKEVATRISNKIEEQIVKNALKFSSLFSGYAEKFLGVNCKLTFEELNGQKRFYPVIDGKIRQEEEELSESQRFFVDHSFRMSILSFFYNKPSFYIIETPDSSLDISYERNAADVFKMFISLFPYKLILTTNLNNSEFLSYLIESNLNVGMIDLLKIGKKSMIQGSNHSLTKVYDKVINNIHEN